MERDLFLKCHAGLYVIPDLFRDGIANVFYFSR